MDAENDICPIWPAQSQEHGIFIVQRQRYDTMPSGLIAVIIQIGDDAFFQFVFIEGIDDALRIPPFKVDVDAVGPHLHSCGLRPIDLQQRARRFHRFSAPCSLYQQRIPD